MKNGSVGVLIVHGSNPLYSLPPASGFADALAKVPLRGVARVDRGRDLGAREPDPAGPRAARIVGRRRGPRRHPRRGAADAAPALRHARRRGHAARRRRARWAPTSPRSCRRAASDRWSSSPSRAPTGTRRCRRGGVFEDAASARGRRQRRGCGSKWPSPQLDGDGEFTLVAAPGALLHDGRGANLPWLQETPDPVTKVMLAVVRGDLAASGREARRARATAT